MANCGTHDRRALPRASKIDATTDSAMPNHRTHATISNARMAIGAISVGVRSRSKKTRISSVEPNPGRGCDASNPAREQTTSSAGMPIRTSISTLSAVKKRRHAPAGRLTRCCVVRRVNSHSFPHHPWAHRTPRSGKSPAAGSGHPSTTVTIS